MAVAEKVEDFCEKHNTPMIKHLEHVGDGNSRWSKPFCLLCEEQKANADKAAAEKPATAKAAEPAAKPPAA